MINKYLKGEMWFTTGSSAYDLPGYEPDDIDICILCEDDRHKRYVYDRIEQFAKQIGATISHENEYDQPFDWGGVTFGRFEVSNYDIFLVDKTTFKTIGKATKCFNGMPDAIKSEMASSKTFRVRMFQIICRQFIKKYNN